MVPRFSHMLLHFMLLYWLFCRVVVIYDAGIVIFVMPKSGRHFCIGLAAQRMRERWGKARQGGVGWGGVGWGGVRWGEVR